jgi:hypothetical protein
MARNGKKSYAFASKAKPKAKKPNVAKNRNEIDALTAELDASLNTTTFHGWTRLPDRGLLQDTSDILHPMSTKVSART